MYNTKFECRYHKDDVFLETDNVTDDEKDFIRNILYREDVLNIFLIDFNDDFEVFNNAINTLYDKIKFFLPFKECMKKMATMIMSEDEQAGLLLMYSYDYMYISHKCVSEYLETGTISDENMKLLSEI
jgi:hypothetical protein